MNVFKMNTTNYYSEHPLYYTESIVIFATFSSFGITGNGFLIILIFVGIKDRQPFEWLLLNLALFDFTFCINGSILQPLYITKYESFGCKLVGFINYVSLIASLSMPSTIAVNRYLSLYNSGLYNKIFTVKNVLFICTLSWLLIIGMILPYAFTNNFRLEDLGVCGVVLSTTEIKFLFSFTIFPLVASTYTVSIICGVKIYQKD